MNSVHLTSGPFAAAAAPPAPPSPEEAELSEAEAEEGATLQQWATSLARLLGVGWGLGPDSDPRKRAPPKKWGGGGYGKICVCVFFFGCLFFDREDVLGLSEIDLLHESAYFFFRELCKFLKGGTCSFRIYIYFLQAYMCIYIYMYIHNRSL